METIDAILVLLFLLGFLRAWTGLIALFTAALELLTAVVELLTALVVTKRRNG